MRIRWRGLELPSRVIFVCFSPETYDVYKHVLAEGVGKP